MRSPGMAVAAIFLRFARDKEMLVDIRGMKAGSRSGEKTLEFSRELDLSGTQQWGRCPFGGPVKVAGTVRGNAGIVTFRYTADYAVTAACARCLEPVTKEMRYAGEYVVLEEAEDEDGGDAYALAPGGILNAGELIAADLLLSLEGIVLCGEECRGLCPKCGKNLNHGDCGCVRHEPDPRFDALRKRML